MKFDLHAHTIFSDGDKTALEVARLAEDKGIGVAITDHDECRGFGEIAELSFAVPVVPGIELAARFEGGSVHVLGLCIDWQNEEIVGHITWARDARRSRAERILEKLRAGGMDVSLSDLEFQGDVVGRAHIAEALVRKRYAQSVQDAFEHFLSFRAPYYVPYEKIGADEAARLIIGAGGLPVLAHPGLMAPGAWDSILPRLRGYGFWGVEAYHPSHTDGQCREFESLARAQGLYVTAGSDFHGSVKPDIVLGQETRGGTYLQESMEAFVAFAGC
jgi:predicted metal-dependent phosphoesterase TrpH